MKCELIAFALVLASSTPSMSQWIYRGKENVPDNKSYHYALAPDGDYGFGLICLRDRLEVIYVIDEAGFDDLAIKMANMTMPKMHVRIDDGDVAELDVTLFGDEGTTTAVAEADLIFFQSVRTARKQVAVGLTIMGKNYHEKAFTARGSNSAVARVISNCGLSLLPQ